MNLLSAKKYFDMYKRLLDTTYWVNEKDFKEAINRARKDAINECADIVMDGNLKDAIIKIKNQIK